MLTDKINAVLASTSQVLTIKQGTPLSYCAYDILNGTNIKMAEVSDKIANVLTKEIILFKDRVVPELAGFVKRVETEVSERVAREGNKKPSMVVFEIPDYILEIADRYKRTSKETIFESGLILPPYEESFMDIYFVSPTDTVKTYREEFMDSISGEDVARIWNTYLTHIGNKNKEIFGLANKNMWSETNINDVYVLEILLKNLESTIPDNVRASLKDYNMRIEGFLNYVQNEIIRRLQVNERTQAAKHVIMNVKSGDVSSDVTILTHKENLQSYLTKGGEINAILGASLVVKDTVNIDQLTLQKEQFVNKWETVNQHNIVSVRTKMVPIYRAVYINAIRSYINEGSPVLKSSIEEDKIITTAIKVIEDASSNELYDCKAISKRLFGEVFFNSTNIIYFLEKTSQYGKAGVDPERAITYATMDMLVEYVGNMIEVE